VEEETKLLITGERLLLALDVLQTWTCEADLSNLRLLSGMSQRPLSSLDKINTIFRARMIFSNQEHEEACRGRFREVYEKHLDLIHEFLTENEDGIRFVVFDANAITHAVMRALPIKEAYAGPFYAFRQIVSDIASGALTEADFNE